MKRVKSYTAKRGNKKVKVKAHNKNVRSRNLTSSFMDKIKENPDGDGMVITILGRDYPYPYLPKGKVASLMASKSKGKYYNRNIRGKFF
tara:strand:+ start:30270 stop:30536 length:267 start_codon:yes stop_codon:yes gene_type:complete